MNKKFNILDNIKLSSEKESSELEEFIVNSNQDQSETDIHNRNPSIPRERPPRPDLRRKKCPTRDPDIERDKIENRKDTGTSVYRKQPPSVQASRLLETKNILEHTIREAAKKEKPEEVDEEKGLKREIVHSDYDFELKNLRDLAKILHLTAISLGNLHNATVRFSKIKSRNVSPDGKLGGHGYVKKIKDIRSGYNQATEVVSDILDTLHDECRANHWRIDSKKTKMTEQIDELIKSTERIIENPSQGVIENKEEQTDERPQQDSI